MKVYLWQNSITWKWKGLSEIWNRCGVKASKKETTVRGRGRKTRRNTKKASLVPSYPRRFRMWRHRFQASSGDSNSASWPDYEAVKKPVSYRYNAERYNAKGIKQKGIRNLWVMLFSVMPLCVIPSCVTPFCLMPLCVMSFCLIPPCVMTFCVIPFSVIPFNVMPFWQFLA